MSPFISKKIKEPSMGLQFRAFVLDILDCYHLVRIAKVEE